ncbi:alpha/beta hydrolase [Desulforhopalus singaporensis]|uniref:AB hydrolase-1 domain-containing protein n=1 Tax=Desulforhopalus singaporensis TaxID=91360 RepID=A0A1H0TL24_9BACT|nr:alpha/beta hydrolase [Desulforhopalus singaporensis]SDP54733.1 hypothetical protein SAMN05660330_03136 [Desulforhopalus singaporensis]
MMIAKTAVTLLLLVVAGYAGLCLLLYVMQRSMLYFPTAEVYRSDIEVVRLKSGKEVLKVWQLEGDNDQAVLYFGGNAEDVALNIEQFKRIFPGYSVFLLNYRGYGGSTGTPTEKGLYADAASLFDYADKRYKRVSVVGRSLGTGVAMDLAANRTVEKLILVTPFDSMVNVAKAHYPLLPVSLMLKDRYTSVDKVDGFRMPILVVTAEDDLVVPRKRSDDLIALLPPELVEAVIIEGVDHSSVCANPVYEQAVRTFMGIAEVIDR